MRKLLSYSLFISLIILSIVLTSREDLKARNIYANKFQINKTQSDTTSKDSIINNKEQIRSRQESYKKDILDKYISQESSDKDKSKYIDNPSFFKTTTAYNYKNRTFFQETKSSNNYKLSNYEVYTLEDYIKNENKKSLSDYWQDKSAEDAGIHDHSGIIPELNFGGKLFDAIFGSNKIVIKPQGSFDLSLGVKMNTVENPTTPESLRSTTMLDFREHMQVNVMGSVGDRLKLDFNYNTQATFDFENNIKVSYTGKEDDIIQEIEAGNVSLPLSGTLINGGQNLFGFKTKLRYGNLDITTLFSQQKGESSVVNLENGGQKKSYKIKAVDYDANKHFFLSKYFADKYDESLSRLPIIHSQINITKIEVWVTNKNADFQKSRNIVAFTDIAEPMKYVYNLIKTSPLNDKGYPANDANDVYSNMTSKNIRSINNVSNTLSAYYITNQDYEKIENASMLNPNEYTLQAQLGYISLNRALNSDEVLAVAYEYTLRDGSIHRVGEFAAEAPAAPDNIFLKLLKGTNLNPKLPQWPLMMKNIYNIGAYGANQDDFQLHLMYRDDNVGTTLNYLSLPNTETDLNNKVLLSVLNLDKLNKQLDYISDGQFDFIEGITIIADKGNIIFPVREPFGSYLKSKFKNQLIANDYTFTELYDESQSDARNIAEKNKFTLEGNYKSSNSSEISLNSTNIKPGGVKVIAGSRELVENIDYTVNYAMGRVKIINQGILESGTPISISSESNSLFSMQTKTLLGTHLDYRISDEINLGATVLHLKESPLTNKISIGNEPISNTIWGINGSYSTESDFLTRMVDAIPLIDTKAKSRITLDAEFAQFIPGQNSSAKSSGNSFVDDFEGSKLAISLKNPYAWKLASSAELNGNINNLTDLSAGYGRAKMAWYNVDPLFYRTEEASMPSHIRNNAEMRSNHYTREIKQTELFPNKDLGIGEINLISAMNIAFYPKERGPYNFESSAIDKDANLKDPSKSWGSIMRKMQTTDFEAANVQYIEFWMMDPFIYKVSSTGGNLCFDLGEISEDILRDSRKSFENGLPISSVADKVEKTNWGYVPTVQSVINGFDNNSQSRAYQDVGIDGLSSSQERSMEFYANFLSDIKTAYTENSVAYKKILDDPSADDYHFFRGTDYDSQELDIESRYKLYNNMEGNSPTADMTNEPYSTAATLLPDTEDINQDNTLNETESFYRYSIPIRPSDMNTSNKYISDVRTATVALPNGKTETVKWYQFKIPLSDYSYKGDINGFKSIRFMRLTLKDFNDDINLRFATLSLVRDNWRMHEKAFNSSDATGKDVQIPIVSNKDILEISSVSIEENAEKKPVNYVLPPNVDREIDPSSNQYTQMNEQALMLKLSNLQDGHSRQIYKNVNLDMLRYTNLKMDVHAEEIQGMGSLASGDVKLFIRIGSDYLNNYYEYELPLLPSNPGFYSDSEADRLAVWPTSNMIDIPLEYFQKLKLARNDAQRVIGSSTSTASRFTLSLADPSLSDSPADAGKLVTIVGNPSLAEVSSIMIGVRNPKDDGQEKSAEIWVNELRLSDFDKSGGWAANIRLNTRLADFANVSIAARKITPGFGSLEQKISQISREDKFQYDFSTSLQLGKFFPDNWRFRLPVYYSLSENTILPEYDPVDTDIKLSDKLNRYSGAERDNIKRNAEKYVSRKSLNFTNVGVEGSGESKIIDIANLSLSYSYNETKKRDIKTDIDVEKNYRGGIAYVYNGNADLVSPLKNVKFLKSPYLQIIRDFNFYYLPSQFSVRTDMSRTYHEMQSRNIDYPNIKINPNYDKDFAWNRYYDLKFDLSKSLSFDFSASSLARIDETEGMVDYDRDPDLYKRWRDTVWSNILSGGRKLQYNHAFTLNYNIPINLIPAFSWINTSVRYTGSYNWQIAPILSDDIEIGNTIKNNNIKQANARFNFLSLYNKSEFLRDINNGNTGRTNRGKTKVVKYNTKIDNLIRRKFYSIKHDLKTKNVNLIVTDKDNKTVNVKFEVKNKNLIKIISNVDIKDAKISVSGSINNDENKSIAKESGTFLARLIMSLRDVSLSYTENNSSVLPGYLPASGMLGTDSYNGTSAPGFDFLIGNTDESFGMKAAQKGWLTKSEDLNAAFTNTLTRTFSARANIEPIRDLRLDLNMRRSYSNDFSQNIVYNNSAFQANNNIETGRFSMTYLSFNSSFFSISNNTGSSSGVYKDFMNNRFTESERLAKLKWADDYKAHFNASTGFYEGYGEASQDVLIPSFFKAYGYGKTNDLFPNLLAMLPNWSIRYSGLRRIDFIAKYFQNISINHSYSCTYNLDSFSTNTAFGDGSQMNISNNFNPQFDVSSISINERFNPLINIDMVWKNSFTTRFEINRSRIMSLSMNNSQLSENSTQEYIIGLGYRFKHLPFIIKQTEFNNDLNLRCDFSIRKNNSIIRKIHDDVSQLTAGQEVMSIKLSADYSLNNMFNLRLFYDRVVNDPYVSLSFRTINSNLGLSLRFTLL